MVSRLPYLLIIFLAAGIVRAQPTQPIEPRPAERRPPEAEQRPQDEAAARMKEERERQASIEEVRNLRYKAPLKHGDNLRWYSEACQRELKAVRAGDRYFEKGDYERARRAYRSALDIRFDQWILERSSDHAGAPPGLPRFEKRSFRLATEQTFWAIERLKESEALSAEARLKEAMAAADSETDPARAYRRYGTILNVCEKMRPSAIVQACMKRARTRREEILGRVLEQLKRVESAIEARDAAAAADAFELLEARYGPFRTHEAVRATYERLSRNPLLVAEQQERNAARRLATGQAALARRDYLSARRSFRSILKDFPDTRSAKTAQGKLSEMERDPLIAQALRLQEAESVCRGLLARARLLARRGDITGAIEACDRVTSEYGDTPWAIEARKLRISLSR